MRRVDGAAIYDRSFSIEPEGPAWLLRIERGERQVEHVHVDTLDNAVRQLISLRKS